MTLLDAALKYMNEGLSVFPTEKPYWTVNEATGEKHAAGKNPAIPTWTEFQNRTPTEQEIRAWNWNGGIALVCGTVSGNFYCLDFDTKNDATGTLIRDFAEILNEIHPGLLNRLPSQKTFSGGRHLFFRAEKTLPKKVLAREENRKTTIEVQGERTYCLVAPTEGYEAKGVIEAAPILLEDEVDALFSAAKSLNRYAQEPVKHSFLAAESNSLKPFDDYDNRTSIQDVADQLTARGWKVVRRLGEAYYLRRPGKSAGLSASLNYVPGKLFIFSSNTEFEPDRAYKPSQIYALLNHSFDFHAAARALSQLGFGEQKAKPKTRLEKLHEIDLTPSETIRVVKVDEIRARIHSLVEKGMDTGLTTGWLPVDGLFRLVKGHLNIVTGIPSHGKSEWVDALLVNAAKIHGWRACFFSPENYPLEIHVRKLAEKVMGRNFFGPGGKVPTKELDEALDFVHKHFEFIDVGESEINLDGILKLAKGYDAVVIDPWNELDNTRGNVPEHDFIGESLSLCRKFARIHKMSFWIVAHPRKMNKDKNGLTPVPNMYDINGSAQWYSKADNGFCLQRDFLENSVSLHVLKVKFRYYGKPGETKFRYMMDGGTFSPWTVGDDFQRQTGVETF